MRIDDRVHGVEKAGGVEGVNSMLDKSHLGIIKLFPNWALHRDASFSGLRTIDAFLVEASLKDCRKGSVRIISDAGRPFLMVVSWEGAVVVGAQDGNKHSFEHGTAPDSGKRTMPLATRWAEGHMVSDNYSANFESIVYSY